MIIDTSELDATAAYQLLVGTIVARAVGRVSTLSTSGVANLAPISFFTAHTLVENVCTTPLDDGVLDVRGGRMRRLDEQDPELGPSDTDAWSPSGSVRTES